MPLTPRKTPITSYPVLASMETTNQDEEDVANDPFFFDKEDWYWTMSHRRYILRNVDVDQAVILKDINAHIGHMLRNRGAAPQNHSRVF